jgi:hypothetical protein
MLPATRTSGLGCVAVKRRIRFLAGGHDHRRIGVTGGAHRNAAARRAVAECW